MFQKKCFDADADVSVLCFFLYAKHHNLILCLSLLLVSTGMGCTNIIFVSFFAFCDRNMGALDLRSIFLFHSLSL